MKLIMVFLLIFTINISAQVIPINNMAQAIATAKAEKKLIFLLLETSYCPWCYRMKNSVIPNSRVQDILEKGYIYVVLQNKKDYIPKEFATTFYPTLMIIDPRDKNIYSKMVGFISTRPLANVLAEKHEMYR